MIPPSHSILLDIIIFWVLIANVFGLVIFFIGRAYWNLFHPKEDEGTDDAIRDLKSWRGD